MSAEPQEDTVTIRPADAVRVGFIDRARRIGPFMRLMRLDRPLGRPLDQVTVDVTPQAHKGVGVLADVIEDRRKRPPMHADCAPAQRAADR